MGLAAEHLGASERERIAMELLDVFDRHCKPGKVGARCPFHVERSPGGAFFYDVGEDLAFCYSCGRGMDLIGLYCHLHGMEPDDPDGFREFMDRYCRGVQFSPERPVRRSSGGETWRPREIAAAPEAWSRAMGEVVRKATARLMDKPNRLDQLAAWGIRPEVAQCLRYGFQEEERYLPYTKVGLPYSENANGRERCVRIPVGLVIPTIASDGRIVRVQVRVDDPGDSGQRYYNLVGGESRYYALGQEDARVVVVVETARDAALVWQELGALGVAAFAVCSASSRPDEASAARLANAEAILLTLDNDEPGAMAAWNWWPEHFPQSLRWPVPKELGKDPGDAALRLDWRAWLLAGLPGHCVRFLKDEEWWLPERPPLVEPSRAVVWDAVDMLHRATRDYGVKLLRSATGAHRLGWAEGDAEALTEQDKAILEAALETARPVLEAAA